LPQWGGVEALEYASAALLYAAARRVTVKSSVGTHDHDAGRCDGRAARRRPQRKRKHRRRIGRHHRRAGLPRARLRGGVQGAQAVAWAILRLSLRWLTRLARCVLCTTADTDRTSQEAGGGDAQRVREGQESTAGGSGGREGEPEQWRYGRRCCSGGGSSFILIVLLSHLQIPTTPRRPTR